MKKHTLTRLQMVLAFCILLVISTHAQPTFIKTIGGIWDEYGISMLQTENGDFVASGFSYTTETENEDFYLLKTDVNGNTIWSKTYGEQLLDWSYSVIETSDGGYLMCGESNTYGTGIYGALLVKTNNLGNLEWQKKYYGDYAAEGRAVLQPDDESFLFCGSTRVVNSFETDVFLVKTDLSGDTLWTRKFGGQARDFAMSMVLSNDGGIVVCGGSKSFGNGVEDIYVVKTDLDGNLIWEKTYGSHYYDTGVKIIQTQDGGYVICGPSTNSSTVFLNVILLRIDADGNEIWTKYFNDTDDVWGRSVAEIPGDGYVVCGAIRKPGADNIEVYLLKLDMDGNEEWTRKFGINENRINSGNEIVATLDGGFAICGYTKADVDLDYYNLLLIKTDDMGIVTSIETIETQASQQLKISPNPSNGKFSVEIPKGSTDIKIFDSKGALLIEENLMENPEKSIRSFDLSNFGKGMYFVNTYTEGKTFNGKVVVE